MSKRQLSSLNLPPGTFAALTRLGYETVQDVIHLSMEELSKEMNVSLDEAETIRSCIGKQANLIKPVPSMAGPSAQPLLTQPASTLMIGMGNVSTRCIPLDHLLGGGIRRGQVVELSGPPGSPKEYLLLNVVLAFVELGLEVVFLETQNMISPAIIHKALKQSESLPSGYMQLVHFVRLHSLPDFMSFVHGLGSFLVAKPSISLLVVNSISYLFQRDPTVTTSSKNALLEQVKQGFAKVCAQRQLTIVTTSQLATKMMKPDGSPGTFDDGARGVMLPPLGNLYLPLGKSHRVMIVPQGRTVGTLKLITPATNSISAQPYRLHGVRQGGYVTEKVDR